MPLAVVCVCGKQFNVHDELAGKRVKCPACQQVVAVPGTLVMPLPPAPAPPDEADETRPRKKAPGAASSSKKWLWIGLGSGCGLLLLLGCCGVGIGAFFFLASRPENIMIGKWQMDLEATRKANPGQFVFDSGVILEIKGDGTLTTTIKNTTVNATWKVISRDGDTVTIDIIDTNPPMTTRARVTAVSRSQLHVRPDRGGAQTIVYKRL